MSAKLYVLTHKVDDFKKKQSDFLHLPIKEDGEDYSIENYQVAFNSDLPVVDCLSDNPGVPYHCYFDDFSNLREQYFDCVRALGLKEMWLFEELLYDALGDKDGYTLSEAIEKLNISYKYPCEEYNGQKIFAEGYGSFYHDTFSDLFEIVENFESKFNAKVLGLRTYQDKYTGDDLIRVIKDEELCYFNLNTEKFIPMNGKMPWEKAILKVLEDSDRAMHYRDITSEIVDKGLRSSENIGATPANTVNAIIHGPKLADKVVSLGGGKYILQSHVAPNPSMISAPDKIMEDEETDVSDALITAYGRFWSREKWEQNNKKMYGTSLVTTNAQCIDFSNHSGIYMLHMGNQVIYVGKATNLRTRIDAHTRDKKRNKWDRFSWFSIQDLECGLEELNKKTLTSDALLDTLEALLIEVLGPERNKQDGNNFIDKEFEQVDEKDFLKFHYSHNK